MYGISKMICSAFLMRVAVATLTFAFATTGAAQPAAARELAVGFLTLASDERYSAQALEKGYPLAPAGRSAAAAQLALDDASFGLQAAGFDQSRVISVEAPDLAGLPAALAGLIKQGVRHVVLELPVDAVVQVTTAARGKDVLLINAAAPEDSLRAAQCAPYLLHALPSHAMQADALGQLLVARKWTKPLVLTGPLPPDQLLVQAFTRSAKRFGIKPVAQRPFKLSGDPRERELGNARLLTASVDYDTVVVLDSAGEFARDLPYRTVLPRPVLGSNGLTAQAWSPWYERHGAPQLNRRFFKQTRRAMGSYDWAAWLATRAIAEVMSQDAKASLAQQLKMLRQGGITIDGYKGQALSFREWDGQLRQPLMLAHGNGVAELAPVEGFLHPKNVLDTLGFDAAETGCKAP
jgi:ABC transporter substrate binding protein (PQQ-dependent alcohol dehydrogenase system)